MKLSLGPYTFTDCNYDAEGDVLTLENASEHLATDWADTEDGDALSFDAHGQLIGITMIDARWRLHANGQIELSVPERQVQLVLSAAQADPIVSRL